MMDGWMERGVAKSTITKPRIYYDIFHHLFNVLVITARVTRGEKQKLFRIWDLRFKSLRCGSR